MMFIVLVTDGINCGRAVRALKPGGYLTDSLDEAAQFVDRDAARAAIDAANFRAIKGGFPRMAYTVVPLHAEPFRLPGDHRTVREQEAAPCNS